MKYTRSASPLLFALAVAGCSAPGTGGTGSGDGEDVASAETIASAPDTSGFVEPTLTADEADAVVASYARLDPEHVVDASLLRRASHMSSLGFALGSETFSGTHGRSLRLDGLSTTNAHLRPRAIIIHGASYVNDGPGQTGRSWGCFALDMAVKDEVIDTLKGGALLFAGLENGG